MRAVCPLGVHTMTFCWRTGGVVIGVAAVALAIPPTMSTATLLAPMKGFRRSRIHFVSFEVGRAAMIGLIKNARPRNAVGPTWQDSIMDVYWV